MSDTVVAEPVAGPSEPVGTTPVRLRTSRPEVAALLVVVAIALLATFLSGTVEWFYYDSNGYYVLSTQFTQGGHWSLYHLTDAYRGFVPVMFFGEMRVIAETLNVDGRDVVRVIDALIFGVIGTVLLPRLAMRCWPGAAFGFVRRVVVGVVFLVFWWGFIAFPLSDVPTLGFALVALLLAARRRRLPWLVLAGFIGCAAMNMRPAYLLFLVGVIVVGVASNGGGPRPALRRLAALGAMVLGAAVIALPQAAITNHNFHIKSPVPGAGAHLGPYQLTVGLQVQFYASYVGEGGRRPMMLFNDPAGAKLIKPTDLDAAGSIKSSSQYVKIALRHPVTFAEVMVRHVVNGLDQRYSTPFTQTLDTGGRRPFRIAGFLLFFAALLRLVWPRARRTMGKTTWLPLVALALAVVTTIPSAMEQRFMLPIFAVALITVAVPGWGRTFDGYDRRQRLRAGGVIAVLAIVFVGGALLIGNRTTSHMVLGATPTSGG